jgi:hypothetical protein
VGPLSGCVVTWCRPGREDEQEPRVLDAMNSVALAWLQHQQSSGFALLDLVGDLNRDTAREHLDDSTFANLMIANALSGTKIKHDRSTLRLREEHLRLLPIERRPPRGVGSSLTVDELVR